LLTVTNTATDGDLPANTLSYQLVNAPIGATIDANGVITWTPAENEGPSTNVITTIVTDNGVPALSATNSFTVIVNEVNNAPVLAVQGDRTVTRFTTLTVTNTATDADLPANTLSYLLVNPPAGATIDANGVIHWTAGAGPATNVFTTVVTDDGTPSLSATNSFTVTVPAAEVVQILSIAVAEGAAHVTWTSVAGHAYRLQYRDQLTDPAWTDVVPDVTATGPVTSATNVVGNLPQRFYRIFVP
jgi:hypothetical protein